MGVLKKTGSGKGCLFVCGCGRVYLGSVRGVRGWLSRTSNAGGFRFLNRMGTGKGLVVDRSFPDKTVLDVEDGFVVKDMEEYLDEYGLDEGEVAPGGLGGEEEDRIAFKRRYAGL